MAKALDVRKENAGKVRNVLEKYRTQIMHALPRHMTVERMLRMSMSCFSLNPKLLDCSAETLFKAVVQCSEMGLEPGNILGQVFLIPFYNSGKKQTDVNVIIGYKGMLALARRSGDVKGINVRLVYENEYNNTNNFSMSFGLETGFSHTPLPPSQRGEKIIGGYAVVTLKDGPPVFEWMWEEEFIRIRNSSQGYKSQKEKSIWVIHPEEMRKKSVIRRIMKYLPLSPEIPAAIAVDEAGDAGKGISEMMVMGDDDIIDVEAEEVQEKTNGKTEALKDRLKNAKETGKEPSLSEDEEFAADAKKRGV